MENLEEKKQNENVERKEIKIYKYLSDKDIIDLKRYNFKHLSYDKLFWDNDNLLLCNEIVKDYEYFTLFNGSDYDEESDEYIEIYQYFLIDEEVAERLQEFTDEIIYFDDRLHLYILGVTHWGSGWSIIQTNIKVDYDKKIAYIEE